MMKLQRVRLSRRCASLILALCLALWTMPLGTDAADHNTSLVCLSAKGSEYAGPTLSQISLVLDSGGLSEGDEPHSFAVHVSANTHKMGSNDAASRGRGQGSEKKSFPFLLIAAIGLVVILVAAGVFFIIWRKNGLKPTPEPFPIPQPEPHPIPPTLPVTEPETQFCPQPEPTVRAEVEMYLEANDGPLFGQMYPIQDAGLLIGRCPEANIRFPENVKGISRKHCQIFWNQGDLQIVDLGSSAGTYISGKGKLIPNMPVPLKEGDSIYLGSKKNCFRLCFRFK